MANIDDTQEVLRRMVDEVEKNPDLYDQVDVKRLPDHLWIINRLLLYKDNNVKAAFKLLRDTMQWRRTNNVNHLKASDYPAEFYQVAELHRYVRDKDGLITCYLRLKMHKAVPGTLDLVLSWLIYMLEAGTQELVEEGIEFPQFGFIWDFTDVSMANIDLALLRRMVDLAIYRYPMATKYIYGYNFPWFLKGLYYVVRSWLPPYYQHVIQFLDKDGLKEKIGIDNLPDYLGGECKTDYRAVPDGCVAYFDDADRFNMNEDDAKLLLSHYSQYMDDTSNVIKDRSRSRMIEASQSR